MKPDRISNLPAGGEWTRALQSHGFAPVAYGWQRENVTASAREGWLILETAALSPRCGRPDIERTGLWKPTGGAPQQRFIFAIPAARMSQDVEAGEAAGAGSSLASALLEWALASARDEVPAGWRPPASDLIADWLPTGGLTVRAGCLVRQGDVVAGQDTWALRCPILPCLPSDLSRDRRLALDLLARDAQNLSRMVRVGCAELSDGPALMAAVDLSGAPHSEQLFLTGLEGLTQAVARLVETADILADATETLRALEVCCQLIK